MFGLLGSGGGKRNTVRIVAPKGARLGLEVLEPRECPADFYWSAAGADNAGLWSNKANWRDANGNAVTRLPTADDNLYFSGTKSNNNSVQDILDNVTITYVGIDEFYMGTLTVPTVLEVKNFGMNGAGARLAGDGSLVIAGGNSSYWSNGEINLCSVTVEANTELQLGRDITTTAVFNNYGTVEARDGTTLTLNNTTFTTHKGATFQTADRDPAPGAITIRSFGASSRFEQAPGAIFKLDEHCTITAPSSISGSVQNGGFVKGLLLQGASELDGTVIDGTNVHVRLLGGDVTHTVNAIKVQSGHVWAEDSNITLTGANTIGGVFHQSGAKVTGNGTLSVVAGGRAEVLSGSWVGIAVNVAVNGNLEFMRTKPLPTKPVVLYPLTIGARHFPTSITNNGRIIINRDQDIDFVDVSSLTNAVGGVLEVTSSVKLAGFDNPNGAPSLKNAGEMRIGRSVQLEVAFSVANSGTLFVRDEAGLNVTGNPDLSFGFSQTAGITKLDEKSSLKAKEDVTITGGTLSVLGKAAEVKGKTISNGGTIALAEPDTVLTANGNYTQTANGTLKIVVATGNKSSKIDVSEKATVDGTVDGSARDAIGNNETFTFLEFTNKAGKFNKLATDDATLKKYNFKYNPTNAQLVPNVNPCATEDTVDANEDNSVTVSVLDNDTDPDDDTLSVAFASDGTNGTTTVNADGTITYTPAAGWSGTDTFTYWVEDGFGGLTVGTVTVTVAAVNDAPTITIGGGVTVAANSGAHAFAGWATGIAAGPPDESEQALTFHVQNDNSGLFSAAPSISADGTLTFSVAPGMTGTAVVTVYLTDDGGTDNGGIDTSATYTFTITVTGEGTGTGTGSGTDIGTGTGSGSGTDGGTGIGSGTDVGSGTGSGTGETGSGTGSGSGTDVGSGTGTGSGYYTGGDSGTGSGTGTGTDGGTGTGTGEGSGTGSGTGTGTGP